MNRFAEMTDEQYFAAMKEFKEKYNAPTVEPIEVTGNELELDDSTP